jgi:hypothetical protein
MFTKLKLQIDLSNIMDVDSSGKVSEEYSVTITFLDKDERFDASVVGESYSYNGTGTFVIKSLWDEKLGSITHNGLLIPTMDKLGIEHRKVFNGDMHRYHFLKKMYVAIEEWANYWNGFQYDSKSKIIVKDNIWEVTCDTIYTGSLRYIDIDVEDNIDNPEDEEWVML